MDTQVSKIKQFLLKGKKKKDIYEPWTKNTRKRLSYPSTTPISIYSSNSFKATVYNSVTPRGPSIYTSIAHKEAK